MSDMMDRMMDTNQWDATIVVLWMAVLAVAAVVVLLAYKVFASGSPGSDSRWSDDGLRILDERYARGEIDRDEYEERRQGIEVGRR
jgi:putative membrane protein